jgi:hypothetical protein
MARPRAVVRFAGYALIGLVLLAAAFIGLVVIAMGVLGIAMVRSDLFGVLVTTYWLIGAPAVGLMSWALAAKRSRAPHA